MMFSKILKELLGKLRGGKIFKYYNKDLAKCQLTVRVFWQSDTYPGWREFYVRDYFYVNGASDIVTLNSGTDDNVRYRVEFWTNSATATGTWTFF